MNANGGSGLSSATRLREIASQLHFDDYERLSLSLSDEDQTLLSLIAEEGVTLADSNLVFETLETRNNLTAEHCFSTLSPSASKVEKFIAADRLWEREISAQVMASGRFLALCHEQADILSAATDVIQSGEMRPYDALQVIAAAIPYLSKIPTTSLLTLYEAQFEITRNDLAGDLLPEALEKRLKGDQPLCRDILEAVRSTPTSANSNLYLVAAIMWLAEAPVEAAELVLCDAKSENPVLVLNATRSLGRALKLCHLPTTHADRALQAVLTNADHTDTIVQRSAIFELVSHSRANEVCAQRTDGLLAEGRRPAFDAVAYFLFSESKSLDQFGRRSAWIEALSKLPADASGALKHFNWILARLLKGSEEELAVATLQRWLLQLPSGALTEDQVLSLMNDTFREITQRQELRDRLVTQWLLCEELRLPRLIGNLISRLSFEQHSPLSFDAEAVSSLDRPGLILLARRMLGYVIYETPLLDLTLSLLRLESTALSLPSLVQSLLIDEIGIDYPQETMDRIKAYSEESGSDETHQLKERVTKAITGYLDTLHALPELMEIRPSPRLAEAFGKAQARAMSKSREKAEEASILRQLATCITLKAGRASFSYRGGGYTTAFPLQTHSVSVTLPRRTVMDKIGHEISNFMYRTARRDEP